MSLYKFTHMSLLTNNVQLKQNKVKKAKRERERESHSPKFIKKIMSLKKKKRIRQSVPGKRANIAHAPRNQKKKWEEAKCPKKPKKKKMPTLTK